MLSKLTNTYIPVASYLVEVRLIPVIYIFKQFLVEQSFKMALKSTKASFTLQSIIYQNIARNLYFFYSCVEVRQLSVVTSRGRTRTLLDKHGFPAS